MSRQLNLRAALARALDLYEREIASAQICGKTVNPHTKALGRQVLFNIFDTDPTARMSATASSLAAFQKRFGDGLLSGALDNAVSIGFVHLGLEANRSENIRNGAQPKTPLSGGNRPGPIP
jgi:hypothetical protein